MQATAERQALLLIGSGIYFGLRTTMTTESPRKNILLTTRSLFTGVDPFLPLPVFGICKKADPTSDIGADSHA